MVVIVVVVMAVMVVRVELLDLVIAVIMLVLEIGWSVRMVMPVGSNPLIQLRALTIDLRRRPQPVFVRVAPGIEVKVIMQL